LVVACFLLFRAASSGPFLPSRTVGLSGVPTLVLYLFVLWGAMVVVLISLAQRVRPPEDEP
jgi:hypothetical protein